MEKTKQRRRWTKEEIEKLEELSNKYTKSDIAKKMNRSVGSVNGKLNALGIGGLINVTDKWTFSMIAEAVGASKNAICRTWKKHGLKYVRRANYYLVNEKDLHKFMKENPCLWDATKCDYSLFCKYDWFMEKLSEDKKIPLDQRGYNWTEYQRNQFILLKKRGFSHREIAEKIGKTQRSIDHYSMRYNKEKKRGRNEEVQLS